MNSRDYERALIGALLSGFKQVPDVARVVGEPDFQDPALGRIWMAALRVHGAGGNIDAHTVFAEMGSGATKLPGGPTLLVDLVHETPLAANAEFYAAEVRKYSRLRALASIGNQCSQLVDDPDADPDLVLDQLQNSVDELRQTRGGGFDVDDIEAVVDVAERGEPHAPSTPWPELTEKLGGWFGGQLVTIGGRPGAGKSVALENCASDMAVSHGSRVLMVSLEMSRKEITQRRMAHVGGVDLSSLRYGRHRLGEREWGLIRSASKMIEEHPIWYVDRSRGKQTLASIRAFAWEAKQAARRDGKPLGMIVVDYVQLVYNSDRKLSRQQQVGEVTRGLKALAGELDVPVLMGAQLNRESSHRSSPTPMLADLREAGDIENDSDVVLLLHPEEVEEQGGKRVKSGAVDAIIAKSRNSQTGSVPLQFFGHYAKLQAA